MSIISGSFTGAQSQVSPGSTLNLNFLTGQLDPRIDFARADSIACATYFDINGLLKTMPVNKIRNSAAIGGSSSTFPTNWSPSNYPNLSPTVVGYGAVSTGGYYIDLRVAGTNSSGTIAYPSISFETVSVTPASVGQIWTCSVYATVISGSTTNFSGIGPQIAEYDSAQIYLNNSYNNIRNSLTTSPTRFSYTRTLSSATTAYTKGSFLFIVPDATTVDITLRLYYPQMELSSTAGTFVLTTGAAGSGPRFDYNPSFPVSSELRGTELVSNGNFSNGSTGWTVGTGWTIGGGVASAVSSTSGGLYDTYTKYTIGRVYEVTFTKTGTSAVTVYLRSGSPSTTTAAGNISMILQAGSSTTRGVEFYIGSSGGTITDISVKEVIPQKLTNELIVNGTFTDSSWWEVNADWTISNGKATHIAGAGTAGISTPVSVVNLGKTYLVTGTLSGRTAGSMYVYIGGRNVKTLSVDGDFIVVASAGSLNTRIEFSSTIDFDGSIDNISAYEVFFSSRGLLIEESRQNLLLQSRDMTQASWIKTDVTPTRNQIGLDGVANTACLMTEGSAGTAVSYQAVTVAANQTITVSEVVKRGNTDWVLFSLSDGISQAANGWFNLSTGAKATINGGGGLTGQASAITSLGSGWYRLSVTGTFTGGATTARIQLYSAAGDGNATRVAGATYIVDCAQLEVGGFATSIIPTTTTALTREADVASMTGTNFNSWWNPTAGTMFAEGTILNSLIDCRLFDISNPSTFNVDLGLRRTAANSVVFVVRDPAGKDANMSTFTTGNIKIIGAFSDNSSPTASFNGSTVATGGAITTLSTATTAYFGRVYNATGYLNGYLRQVSFYNTRLPNVRLQSLTT